jgi:hypothetical protein
VSALLSAAQMVALVLTLFAVAQGTPCSKQPSDGKSIYDFDLTTLSGEPLSLQKGKQVLLVNVATY